MKTAVAFILFAAALAFGGSCPAQAAESCDAVGELHFICGPMNSEDLVQVPGTNWLVASGFAGGGAETGHLYLIDSLGKSWKPLFPTGQPRLRQDKADYAGCPGAPDLRKFSTHGLNLRPNSGGTATLFVVNHGGREAIEMFTLDTKGPEPTVTWVGCAVMPGHTWPNSVAPLPDGGIIVTSMFDPGDKQGPDKMNAGSDTGAVYEWHPQTGFKMIAGSEMSGDNGIEVSRDGKWIYLAAWGNQAVARLPRVGGKPEVLKAGFLVDNLRWAPDGKLLVTGQDVPAKEVFNCFESKQARCTQPWRVTAWDTAAMKLQPVFSDKGNPGFGDATVTLATDNGMFVGTFRGDRIAYFSVK